MSRTMAEALEVPAAVVFAETGAGLSEVDDASVRGVSSVAFLACWDM